MGWQNSVGWVLFSLIICLPVHHWRARPGLFQTFQNQSWHLCLENELKIISSPSLISSHRESKTDFLKNHDHKLLYLLMQYFVLFGFLLECYRCIVSTLRRNTFKGYVFHFQVVYEHKILYAKFCSLMQTIIWFFDSLQISPLLFLALCKWKIVYFTLKI